MIIDKLLKLTTHGPNLNIPIKQPNFSLQPAEEIAEPTADTLGITPVLAISGPSLINRDGVFIRMAQILPMDLGPGDQNLDRVISCFIQSVGKLPPFINLQLTSLPSPYDGSKDLEHFLRRSKEYGMMAQSSKDASENWRRQYTNLGLAAYSMGIGLASWFDAAHPRQQSLLLTMTLDPSSGINRGQLIDKNGAVNFNILQSLQAQSPAVNEKLSEEFLLVLQAFKNSKISIQELQPGEMCRHIWTAMHPLAVGKTGETSRDMAAELMENRTPFNRIPDAEAFEYAGTPEALAHLLVPNTFVEQEKYLQIDGAYCAGYVVYDFTPYQSANVSCLPDLPGAIAASLYLEVKDPAEMAEKMRGRQTQLAGDMISRNRWGMVEDNIAIDELTTVKSARRMVESARQMPIYIRFYVQQSAATLDALDKQCKDLERALRLAGAAFFPVRWTQMPLWESILPCGLNTIAQKPRNMTAESLGPFFWPPRTFLNEAENGTYIAIDNDTGTPIFYDFFGDRNDRNPSWLLLGKVGSGKSVTVRSLNTSFLIDGGRVFMLDIEGENREWCEYYGGRYVEIGLPGGETINPLDAPPDSTQPVEDSIHQFLSFYQIIMGLKSPLEEGPAKNTLIAAYMSVLEDRGWVRRDPQTGLWSPSLSIEDYDSRDAPILSDITSVLANMGEVGISLVEKFLQFSDKTGLYSRYTNLRTSFNIRTERLVCFGLKHLIEHDPVMLNLSLYEVLQMIWSEILRSNSQNPEIIHSVPIDECRFFLDIPTAADWLEKVGSRLRKRKGSIGLASQKAHEFLDNPSGRRILSVMGTKFLLGQEVTEINNLKNLLGLTDLEASYLADTETGNGLALFPKGVHKRIHIDAPVDWRVIRPKDAVPS